MHPQLLSYRPSTHTQVQILTYCGLKKHQKKNTVFLKTSPQKKIKNIRKKKNYPPPPKKKIIVMIMKSGFPTFVLTFGGFLLLGDLTLHLIHLLSFFIQLELLLHLSATKKPKPSADIRWILLDLSWDFRWKRNGTMLFWCGLFPLVSVFACCGGPLNGTCQKSEHAKSFLGWKTTLGKGVNSVFWGSQEATNIFMKSNAASTGEGAPPIVNPAPALCQWAPVFLIQHIALSKSWEKSPKLPKLPMKKISQLR